MPAIILTTLNAKYIHSAFGLRYLLANMGDLRADTCLIEFDINHFASGRGYIFGTECRIAVGHVWAVWDNPHNRWIDTPIVCHPKSNDWNHLVIEVERTTNNKLLYKTITLNGDKQTLNWYNDSTAINWHGVTVNFQIDGNYKQEPYSVYLDKFNFTYY